MAEEKAYLDLQEEDGRILITFAALGEIAAEAALAVSSVAGLANVPQAAVKGVRVELSEIGICTIEVHILVQQGTVFSQTAKAVQRAVKLAVDAAAGIEVAAVNVFVAGLALK